MSKEDKGLSTLYFSKYLGKSDDPHYDTLWELNNQATRVYPQGHRHIERNSTDTQKPKNIKFEILIYNVVKFSSTKSKKICSLYEKKSLKNNKIYFNNIEITTPGTE
jgi:hypothetical protein